MIQLHPQKNPLFRQKVASLYKSSSLSISGLETGGGERQKINYRKFTMIFAALGYRCY
jgi:hypothetical protein